VPLLWNKIGKKSTPFGKVERFLRRNHGEFYKKILLLFEIELPMVQGRKTFDVANGVTGLSEKYHHVMALTARNQISGFAAKTRKNVDFIISSRANGADVHEVTQLMLSLLGLIVFPKEKGLDERVESAKINTLAEQGWPYQPFRKACVALWVA
jgi:hypothetical protein